MRHSIVLVLLVLACSSSKTNGQIGPDGLLPDGGKLDPTDPSRPTPSDPSKVGTSGTRLKARTYTSDDGAKQFVGWYDSELKRDCNFLPAADGKLRCLPSSATMSGFFSDAGCTQLLATVGKGCAPPPTVQSVVAASAACTGSSYKLSNLGAKHGGPIFNGTPSACAALTPASAPFTTDIFDYYAVGTEVSLATFVAGTETRD